MKNPVVIYSSLTGNTKLVAEKIRETLGTENFFDVQNAPKDLSGYDVIFLGYWLKRGAPDPNMKIFLPNVHDAKIILFQTHGTEKNSEHAVTAFARAAYLLGKNCEIVGTFGCCGKINPALIERRKKIPGDPHGGEKGFARQKNSSTHPDEQDLQDAAEFVEKMKLKLQRLEKFEKNFSPENNSPA